MFEFVKPEDRPKFATLVIAMIFVFSTIAIYTANRSGSSDVPAPKSGDGGLDTFNGTAIINATMTRWEPTLLVQGISPRLEARVEQLKAEGTILYDTRTGDGWLLRLADSRQVYPVANELMDLGTSVTGFASISIPSVRLEGGSIAQTVSGGAFSGLRLEPVFAQGDLVPMQILAGASGGQLNTLINLAVLPGAPIEAEIEPRNATLNYTFWRTLVPWELRNINHAQLEANMLGGSSVFYKPRSFVTFDPPLNSGQLTLLNSRLPTYATTLQPGLMGVERNMTDRRRVQQDLGAVGIQPNFTDSPMDIRPYRENKTDEQAEEYIKTAWNSTYEGLQANFTKTYRLLVDLPSTLNGSDGRTYWMANHTFFLNSRHPPMEGGTVKLTFTPMGRRVTVFEFAQYSPRGQLTPLEELVANAGVKDASEGGNRTAASAGGPNANPNASSGAGTAGQTDGTAPLGNRTGG